MTTSVILTAVLCEINIDHDVILHHGPITACSPPIDIDELKDIDTAL